MQNARIAAILFGLASLGGAALFVSAAQAQDNPPNDATCAANAGSLECQRHPEIFYRSDPNQARPWELTCSQRPENCGPQPTPAYRAVATLPGVTPITPAPSVVASNPRR